MKRMWPKVRRKLYKQGNFEWKAFILLLFLAACGWLLASKTTTTDWQQVRQTWRHPFWLIIVLLMPLNWLLEAIKWRLLLRSIQPTSLQIALNQVIKGVAIGNFAPMLVGDVVGRIGISGASGKKQQGIALLYGHFVQGCVMGILAAASGWYLLATTPAFGWLWGFIIVLGAASVMSCVVAAMPTNWLKKRRWARSFLTYERPNFMQIFGLALLRHVVFMLQFGLAIKAVGIPLSWPMAFAAVNLIFIFKTLGALIGFLGDVALRQLSALTLLGKLGGSVAAISVATLGVWFINLFIPLLVGVVLFTKSSRLVSKSAVS